MLDMARRGILPALAAFTRNLAGGAREKAELNIPADYEIDTLRALSKRMAKMHESAESLDAAIAATPASSALEAARYCRDRLLPLMRALRAAADEAELLTGAKDWPYPTYGEMLFSVM